MSRSNRHPVPSSIDLDGISVGIVRLHDYYNFNISYFASAGVWAKSEFKSKSIGNLTTWDVFRIGLKGCNKMLLGSGIEFMNHALQMSMLGSISVPPFIDPIDQKVLRNLIHTGIKYK